VKVIGIITCTKRKKHTKKPIPAKELYSASPLFRYSYEYFRKVLGLRDEQIFILSAKHNLINVNKKIKFYDKTFNNPPERWLKILKRRLDRLKPQKIYFIGSEKYIKKFLEEYEEYRKKFVIIAEGLSIGKKMSWLKKKLKKEENITYNYSFMI